MVPLGALNSYTHPPAQGGGRRGDGGRRGEGGEGCILYKKSVEYLVKYSNTIVITVNKAHLGVSFFRRKKYLSVLKSHPST